MRARALRWRIFRAVALFSAVVILGAPSAVPAAIFEISSGFRQNGFNLYGSGEPATVDSGAFSYRGALCPAAGTPNFLCGRIRGYSGFAGGDSGRILLRAEARLKRTNADATSPELAAYVDARAYSGPIGGYAATAPGAYFVFGLGGTLVNTKTDPDVTTFAFAVAELAGSGPYQAVQCFGVACLPKEIVQVKVEDWNVSSGFYLRLRSDVGITNFPGKTGWDAEVVADFADTLELLAIQLLDENDQPIPNVHLTVKNAAGEDVPIPDTPPATPTPTATPPPGATTTPTPLPTVTPCADPPCEDCENCVDDDGDTLVDRADPDCASPANGNGAGLADPVAAKALDACAKRIRKGGRTLVLARLASLRACVKSVSDCVQLKGGDGACLAKAQTSCTKAREALTAAAQKVDAALVKACGEPAVAAGDLVAAAGLGYAADAEACARRGIASLATMADVAACVALRQACAVERLLGFAVPRAGELATVGGWDAATALPCLDATSVGGGAGIGADKAKALRKCDAAIQKAVAKLAAGRVKAGHACGAGVFGCLQTKPGDPRCLGKASAKCTKALGVLPAIVAAFTAAITKACDTPPLGIADLRAPEGLGFATRTAACAGRGTPALATVADVAQCLEREVACRADQVLESQAPRFRELLQAAGAPAP